jgi:DnaK suppressor protein
LRQQVDEALLRLEGGTFGACEDCGGKIAHDRLDALPYARLCIRCAKRTK